MESIAWAMSSAVRVAVPLNSMCSTKCAIPPRSAVSWRDPRVSHTPMLIERTCDMRSVRIRRPLSRTSRTMGAFDKMNPHVTIEGPVSAEQRERYVSTESSRLALAELERPALEAVLDARGHQRFHAGQVFRWLYLRGVSDPAAMTDLSREFRAELARTFTFSTPEVVQRERSLDGT